jgi:Nuclease-related domain
MEPSGASPRWHGQKSSFPWEQDALNHIKAQIPEAEPYRAWQTFTFTTGYGHVREVDLFIATPGGLFLVEIKSHPDGTAAAAEVPEETMPVLSGPAHRGFGQSAALSEIHSRENGRGLSQYPPEGSLARGSASAL